MMPAASIVIYAGMIQPQSKQPYELLIDMITSDNVLANKEIISYKIPIQSFMGESVFLFIKQQKSIHN